MFYDNVIDAEVLNYSTIWRGQNLLKPNAVLPKCEFLLKE